MSQRRFITQILTLFVEGAARGCIVGFVPALLLPFESIRAAAGFLAIVALVFGIVAAFTRPRALEKFTAYLLTLFNL